jgi:N-acetylmuramoyl-L-alanine amidase
VIPPLKDLTTVIIHHSGGPRAQTFEAIQRHHIVSNGWQACGYHVVIDERGEIYRGRQLPKQGAHCPGMNHLALGICLVGDNTKTDHRWLPVQVSALRRYLHALDVVVPGLQLIGHRDAKATACPGITTDELRLLLGR